MKPYTLDWLPLFHPLNDGVNGYSRLTGEEIDSILSPVSLIQTPFARETRRHLEAYLMLSEAGRAAAFTRLMMKHWSMVPCCFEGY